MKSSRVCWRPGPSGFSRNKDTNTPKGGPTTQSGQPFPSSAPVDAVLTTAYGDDAGLHGLSTAGHNAALTPAEVLLEEAERHDFQYGEVLPAGVRKALGEAHLDAQSGRSLVELGAGTGKVALQAFLECPSLLRVTAVELAAARYRVGEAALLRLCERIPERFSLLAHAPGACVRISERPPAADTSAHQREGSSRELELSVGDVFELGAAARAALAEADVVFFEVCLPRTAEAAARGLALLRSTKAGSRVLSYEALEALEEEAAGGSTARAPCRLRGPEQASQRGVTLRPRAAVGVQPKGAPAGLRRGRRRRGARCAQAERAKPVCAQARQRLARRHVRRVVGAGGGLPLSLLHTRGRASNQ